MLLIPPESPELLQLVTTWLSHKENYEWLDFGDGRQHASREWLKMAMHRQSSVLRVFTSDREYQPIGIVGFNNLNVHFGTANVWVVLGEKAFACQGYATRAVSRLMSYGFGELHLRSIHTWVVDSSVSLKIVRRLGFREIGRQRQCHRISGQPLDRLWFDLLAGEHRDIDDERREIALQPDRTAVL